MPVKKNPLYKLYDDPEELLYKDRMRLAMESIIDSNGRLFIRKAALIHGLEWERLWDRIYGVKPKKEAIQSRQLLDPREEEIMERHIR
jgi:hypothetical protein